MLFVLLFLIVVSGLVTLVILKKRNQTSPKPTPPTPAPGTPAAQPLWRRWAWPVGIILVVLTLANANVRETLWTTGAPAVQSWTTGAKTFDATITSSDEFVIGDLPSGKWLSAVSKMQYWCKTSDGTVYYGVFSGEHKLVSKAAKIPSLTHTALLLTTKNALSKSWRSPGETILSTEGDTLYGMVNAPNGCKMVQPVRIQVTVTPY
jgi:hypothetical protein